MEVRKIIHQTTIVLLLTFFLVGSVACTAGGSTTVSKREVEYHGLTPEEYGVIGAKVYKSTDRSNQILQRHGLTREEFDEAISRITADASLSKRYKRAFEKELNQ